MWKTKRTSEKTGERRDTVLKKKQGKNQHQKGIGEKITITE